MRTFDELEALWQAGPAPLRQQGKLHLIVARIPGGEHRTPAAAELHVAGGLLGDRWSHGETPNLEEQITVMNVRVAELLGGGEQPLHAPGDNLLVDLDLSEEALPAGTRVRLGQALLEVTPKPHTGCKKFAAKFGQDALRWVSWRDWRTRRLRGVHLRVLEGGPVAVGDAFSVLPPA